MNKFIDRLKEPSSWAGLSMLAVLAGVQMDDQTLQAMQGIAYAFAGAAGAASVVIPERKKNG